MQHWRERGDVVSQHDGHWPRIFDRQQLRMLVEKAPNAMLPTSLTTEVTR